MVARYRIEPAGVPGPTRGFSALVTPFQPRSLNNLAGSLPDYCTTVPNRAPRSTQISRREYKKNKLCITTKPAHQNTYSHDTLTVRRLPICRNLLFDAPAATRQPTASHIWHLINIHRAAITLPASSLCSTHRLSLARRPWFRGSFSYLANRWRRRACSRATCR